MPYAKISPSSFDLFTGGKQPELAIAFNQAYDNTQQYINSLMEWPPTTDSLQNLNELDDRAFVYLRQYLWKGNSENKNGAGYALEPADRSTILHLLRKMITLRNFHSHYWHDNSAVSFDLDLRRFVSDKHDQACGQLLQVSSIDAELYLKQIQRYPLFKDNQFITQEGRVFFLSLFLNRGQMQHLLQQRKGSKRHDLPEYRFKHKLFTYYCHREGAASLNTGIDNSLLPTMAESEKKRIYNGRQANRILSYLKDRPDIEAKHQLPLVLSSGQAVEDMPSLLHFISEKELLPGFTFYQKERIPAEAHRDERKANETEKNMEAKQRQGFRRFTLPGDTSYEFEISYPVLRQITTTILIDQNNPDRDPSIVSDRDHFIGVLKDCIDTRRYIYENLKNASTAPITPDSFSLKKKYSSIYIDYSLHEGSIQERYYNGNEWRAIPISPNLHTEKLLIEWHNNFTMGKESEPQHRLKLLNAIRPITEPYQNHTTESKRMNNRRISQPGARSNYNRPARTQAQPCDPEPLLFHLAYYYREQENNLRQEDRFLEWGVRYLMDMELVPDWHFEIEQLVYEQKYNEPDSPYKLKQKLRWEKTIPENHRLRIRDNQVNVGIRRGNRFFRLRIGERLLKYLLHWHFIEPNKKGLAINDFLLAVTKDLEQVHTSATPISPDQLDVIDTFSIPALYFKTKIRSGAFLPQPVSSVKDQTRKYLIERINWIDDQLSSLKKLSRNQKNEILLDAYRLYDFSTTEGSKFLRKNEYGQMSICHYMLNQNKDKVFHLIPKTFKLHKRLPREIIDLVYEVVGEERGNLDTLCTRVLADRRKFLQDKLTLLNIAGLKAKQILKEIVGNLPVHISDENLSPEKLEQRKYIRSASLDHIPFAVHPALALKYLYPEEFAKQGFCKEGGKYKNLFLQLRKNPGFTSPLPAENYPEAAYQKILGDYLTQFPDKPEYKSTLGKIIGSLNENKAKDIFLLQIAEKYLASYDPHVMEEFMRLRKLKALNLEQLFSAPSIVPLPLEQSLNRELDDATKRHLPAHIYLQLQLHQLDDYFYRSQKANLGRLAVFYILWRKEELERYKDHPSIVEQLTKWPDGTKQAPLTIGNLIEARRLNEDHAAELTGYLFNYEARILNEHFHPADKDEKQNKLEQFSSQHERGKYISFKSILSWDLTTPAAIKAQIDDLRFRCMHGIVPINGSYRSMSLPGTPIAEILGISEPLGKDRTVPNIYEQNEQFEANVS